MSEDSQEKKYENVRIVKMADGTTIEGHGAVKEYIEKEEDIYREHGATINFQVYRVNLQATTIKDFQGQRLDEIKLPESFVSGDDTVAAVKDKLRQLLIDNSSTQLSPANGEHFSFSFNGRSMKDDRLFYADHFMMLPSWIQVVIHRCEFDELIDLMSKLRNE
jgi:hypothetical protein